MDQQHLSRQQFDNSANAYLESATHAQGKDLDLLREQAATIKPNRVLDLGCGAGHVSFTMAPYVAELIAYDLSKTMLDLVTQEAEHRQLSSIRAHQGPAEQLPFTADYFDWIVTRFSAHHWTDVPTALLEIRRVLKPSGQLVLIDILSPEAPGLDTFLQSIEFLRDPSHVRDYRVSEWLTLFEQAGFHTRLEQTWSLPIHVQDWVDRMRTPDIARRAIAGIFETATDESRRHFHLSEGKAFSLDAGWFTAN